MKKIVYLLTLAVAALSLASCQKDKEEKGDEMGPSTVPVIVEINNEPGNFTLEVPTNIKREDCLVTISYPETEKNFISEAVKEATKALPIQDFTFTAKAWAGTTVRKAEITISNKKEDVFTKFLIRQSPAPSSITVALSKQDGVIETVGDDGLRIIDVTDNQNQKDVRFNVSGQMKNFIAELYVAGSWANLVSDPGVSPVAVRVAPVTLGDIAEYSSDRKATLIIKTADGAASEKFVISQAPRIAGKYMVSQDHVDAYYNWLEEMNKPAEPSTGEGEGETPAPTGPTEDQLIENSVIGRLIESENPLYRSTMEEVSVTIKDGVVYPANAPEALSGQPFAMSTDDIKAIASMAPAMTKLDLSKSRLAEIPAQVFNKNTVIKEVILPSELKVIGASAFEGCSALVSLDLSNGVETINDRAFYSAPLTSTSLFIPRTIQKIGTNAFYGNKLAGLSFEEPNEEYIKGTTSRLEVGVGAFQATTAPAGTGGSVSKDIVIPNWVSKIGNNAFAGLSRQNTNAIKVVIGTNVTEIGTGAFTCNINVTSIEFKDSDVKIKIGENGATSSASSSGGAFSVTGITEITYPMHSRISNTRVPRNIFFGCIHLKTIKISEGVTEIGTGAFGCSSAVPVGYTSITFPSTLTTIEKAAFTGVMQYPAVVDLSGTALESIGETAFYLGYTPKETAATYEILLPATLKTIGKQAFAGTSTVNSLLEKIDLSNTKVTAIVDQTFEYSSLSDFKASSSHATIGKNAFRNCKALSNKPMWFPESVRPASGNPTGTEGTAFTGVSPLPKFYYGTDAIPQ